MDYAVELAVNCDLKKILDFSTRIVSPRLQYDYKTWHSDQIASSYCCHTFCIDDFC